MGTGVTSTNQAARLFEAGRYRHQPGEQQPLPVPCYYALWNRSRQRLLGSAQKEYGLAIWQFDMVHAQQVQGR